MENLDKALQTIGSGMAQAGPPGWKNARLTISAVASLIRAKMAYELDDGSLDTSTGIDGYTQLACGDLRTSMYREGSGTWYNATFTLTSDGRLETDFDYDNPPFDGDYEAELLEDDQERYPRSQENLPAWHPSRVAQSR
ncbi:antitoxin YezG family protein [Microlunatus parietis]|uniref:DUF600 family protein n=1 Tax=Microlunatus parietis TaxID=682979 RepID=A0A7Y9LF51_9ACTN|nr:immunity protein YezG family protein [Microlunatus parietis]NYE74595.1 hypothetical protein [Microlunatus parietis]